MPFTLAHAAVALPARRCRFVLSAFVVGAMAPDFEYFLRLTARIRGGHTLSGVVVFTLPAALAVLWLFHNVVKQPVLALLPESVASRAAGFLAPFGFGGVRRFLHIVVSVVAGIATHLLWDSFTHAGTWQYRHWPILHHAYVVPIIGSVRVVKLLQYVSTVGGLAVLAIWFIFWFRKTPPSPNYIASGLPAWRKMAIIMAMLSVAMIIAAAYVVATLGFPIQVAGSEKQVVRFVVAVIGFFSAQLVLFCLSRKKGELLQSRLAVLGSTPTNASSQANHRGIGPGLRY